MANLEYKFEYYVTFLGSNLLFSHVLSVANCFPLSHNIALSVVSMELWLPHKMAEIMPAHGNDRLPDPRKNKTHDIHDMNRIMH